MTRRVDNEEAGNFQVKRLSVFHVVKVLLQVFHWEVSRTNLLRDTAGLTSLHICFAQLVKDQRLASIDVAHHADDRASQVPLLFGSSALCL